MESYMYHHGVKGQKWGVRRYQDKNGRLTKEGKAHAMYGRNVKRNLPYTKDKNEIVNTMSKLDKIRLGAPLKEQWIDLGHEREIIGNLAYSMVKKYGNVPVSFVEVWTNGGRTGYVAVGTRSGDEYRGKGYASSAVEDALNWCDRYGKQMMDELEWQARADNVGSNKLANKYGFELVRTSEYKGHDWNHYKKKL